MSVFAESPMFRQAVELPRGFGQFVRDLFRSRRLIAQLSLREFRNRYLGSSLGLIWALVHPASMIVLYWFVLQLALGNPNIGDVPFVLWLMCALVPFFFLSESISAGATAIVENAFLVKKVVFRVNMLPVVRLLALVPIHLIFVGLILALTLCYHRQIPLYCLQIPYYFFAGCCLCLGISFLTSALMPFLRDTVQVIAVLTQFLFWLTPVIWSPNTLLVAKRPMVLPILEANPLFYLVQGYRESLGASRGFWFWQHWLLTIYFWGVTLVFLVIGMLVFKRLRPHFADVV
ncbi:MAG: ABC transporter permease [Tepidisphaeraceae bacterium]